MTQARITITTQYADPGANPDFATDFPNLEAPAPVMVRPHAYVESFDFDAMIADEALVADTTASNHEIALDFGDVDEALGFVIKNRSGQDLSVAVNGLLAGIPGTAVTAAIAALDSAVTDQFMILDAFTAMDAATDIVAAIATASAAVSSAQSDLDDALSAEEAAFFTLPDGGVLACSLPAGASSPVTGISLYTTATQSGDGFVEYKVFGSAAA